MLKEVLSAIKWLLSARPSIWTMHWGPHIYVLPSHLLCKFDATDAPPVWAVAGVTVENISRRTLDLVRIKLNCRLVADPEVTVGNKNYSDWEFDGSKGELTIRNIDPKTLLHVNVFCPADDRQCDIAPEILVDGVLHGKVQNFIAIFINLLKGKLGVPLAAVVAISFASIGFAYTRVIEPCALRNSDACQVEQAASRISSYCRLKVEHVTTGTRLKIESTGFPVDMTLFVNKARSMDELLIQDKIVICAPIIEARF